MHSGAVAIAALLFVRPSRLNTSHDEAIAEGPFDAVIEGRPLSQNANDDDRDQSLTFRIFQLFAKVRTYLDAAQADRHVCSFSPTLNYTRVLCCWSCCRANFGRSWGLDVATSS